jgi:hypothetical protein
LFILYDENMNIINYPDGVIPLDIFIPSIKKERVTERLEGTDGKIDYGATYSDRDPIELKMLLKANDTRDYRLLRNAVYAMVDNIAYVSEEYERGKRYRVNVDESFIPERIPGNQRVATADVNCVMPGLPFAESIGTTQDIQVTDHEGDLSTLPLNQELWESGGISYTTGNNFANKTQLRLIDYINVDPNKDYEFSVSKGKELFIREYDALKSFVNTPSQKVTEGYARTIKTNRKTRYIRVYFNTDENVIPDDIGINLIANVVPVNNDPYGLSSNIDLWGFGMGLQSVNETYKYIQQTQQGIPFQIYNAGKLPIHPFDQYLCIEISNVEYSTSYFELKNKTNGSSFRVTEKVNPDHYIKIDGPDITVNNLAALRKTNKQYVQLSPGVNVFTINGAKNATIKFDFRFYYL